MKYSQTPVYYIAFYETLHYFLVLYVYMILFSTKHYRN